MSSTSSMFVVVEISDIITFWITKGNSLNLTAFTDLGFLGVQIEKIF